MSADIQVRRATLDDLPKLIELWKLERFPVEDFERRFKEFQVAQGAEREILGVIGLQISGADARIHSESFARFDMADDLRRRFWERFKVMGDTQGWIRVWTECSSPAWREAGFDPATTEQLSRLPDAFSARSRDAWMVIQLRAERSHAAPIEAEFELLKMAHQSENERMLRRARIFRNFALLMAFSIIAWIAWWGFKLYQHRDQLPRP
ncbi:MAG: hypothetical protein HYR88_06450 [Verrucomicrobia bacterium]|nr:hypothetical protein [Verrucomicrobiota bacterium]MBI3869742.1 hypothetical protein [Verrucomicrobiota bacterium]